LESCFACAETESISSSPFAASSSGGDQVVDLIDRVLTALGRLEHRVAVLGLGRRLRCR
jgi:hypothetical protein